MKSYVIFEEATGRVISAATCPGRAFMPAEGPLPDAPGRAVKHGACCPTNERVENGRFVPVGLQEKRLRTHRIAWGAFRLARERMLTSKDYLLAAHYPLSATQRAHLLDQFQRTRDIPQQTNDPDEAMALLDQIWSTT
jgi:hypothetical protein